MLKVLCIPHVSGWITATLLLFAGTVDAKCKLNVGWEPWEPYQYEEGGEVTGLDYDLLKAMAKEADCELVFVKLPWKRLLEELKRGKIDVTSGASKSEERAVYAHFSEPYREETMVLYVRAGEVEKYPFTGFLDMIKADFKVGIVRDYLYGDSFSEAMKVPDFSTLVFDVAADLQNFKKLEVGRVDGVLVDRFVGPDLIRDNGLQGKFAVHPMPVSSTEVHLMFSKASVQDDLVQRLNQAIQAVKANGFYDRILGKYLQ